MLSIPRSSTYARISASLCFRLGTAVRLHGFLGSREVGGEVVRPRTVALGDKVEVTGVRWGERRLQRRQARTRDRARGQPRVLIRVVRVAAGEVGAMDHATVTVVEQGCVDGGRIAVELHADPQPVRIYGGH